MWRLRSLAVVLIVLVAACGDDDGAARAPGDADAAEDTTTSDTPTGEPVTAFTWTTTMDQGGSGYELVVDGVVGEGHAAYAMAVEPIVGAAVQEGDDVLAGLAGLAVNGFGEPGEGVELSTGEIVAADGQTTVRVLGGERWYRNPWLLDDADFAMGDAEWVRVVSDEAAIADLVTAVLNERYDDALRDLLAMVDAGEVQAPVADPDRIQIDEILTPWIGLAGPDYPLGGTATITGDATEGEVRWTQELTAAVDGTDGELSGHVRWAPDHAEPPVEPDAVIALPDLTARLAG